MADKRSGRWRLARLGVFASGDFAFNLYWQSIMLYLLFYYTEVLHLPIEVAAATYLVASVWDGLISFAVGFIADQRYAARYFRRALIFGAAPLGLSFILAYWPPPGSGMLRLALILTGHLFLRTAYAWVNIPYLTMSARISTLSHERALVAGMRMLAGAAAGVVVATGTRHIGFWLTGDYDARSYSVSASLFALCATLLLIVVGLSYRDDALPPEHQAHTMPALLHAAFRNRAFTTLCGAMMAMTIAVTVLNKSVLYFFKYSVGDQNIGQLTLGSMMTMSAVAVPFWTFCARQIGVRALWLLTTVLCVCALMALLLLQPKGATSVALFLILIQGIIAGLNLAVWAMMPDTVEFGQAISGVRAEATLYGLLALFQRVAIGLGTGLLGFSLGSAGFVSGTHPTSATLTALRMAMILIPCVFFCLAGVIIFYNPLRRDTHDALVLR
ncbi:MAG: MFS transporter, partial [Alphaproteobacteria bacterium]|nr:MFS transporter [Alphaproteobacteria bacterium]